MSTTSVQRGHRIRAHTADEILEAWGPTREACLEEAVVALVDSVANVEQVSGWRHREVLLSGTDEEILVALLEEVIYHLEVDGAVPALALVHPHGESVLAHLWLIDLDPAATCGAAPKGVSYSQQLNFRQQAPDRWWCTATVDV
jgi:SHS2 domain-containing protein